VGRRAERPAVEQVLTRARAGDSGALVLRGKAGIGKTALLEQGRGAGVAERVATGATSPEVTGELFLSLEHAPSTVPTAEDG
jgi:ATP-dependent Clp protease ATP-binding subunit ClpA